MNKVVFYFVKTSETSCCPICAGLLLMRGRRERVFIESNGRKVKLVIRRLYCDECRCTHHELADCIVPYKRHCAETIEKIILCKALDVPCETESIRRILLWWKAVHQYFINILKSLEEKHKISYRDSPAFKEIVRAVVNSNNWIIPQTRCTQTDWESGTSA